jgi:hypothetical protein
MQCNTNYTYEDKNYDFINLNVIKSYKKKYNLSQIRTMNPFRKLWFWLLILSIIGFIIAFVLFEMYGQTTTGNTSTPGWIWIIFILSLLFWVIALILYAVDVAAYHKRMEIAEACGELPPPLPKKKIECPKKECVEKKVVECVQKRPCDTVDKSIVVPVDTPAVPKVITTTTTTSTDEAFSAAGLKPLSTLAPPPIPTQ